MNDLPEAFQDSAWLHGATAFTTLRTQRGLPLLWAEHLDRLADTCAFLGLPDPRPALSGGPGPLEAFPEGRLRLTVAASGLWRSHTPLPPQDVQDGVRVWLSEVQVHPQLAGHKTGNYLPYLLARREAQARGCFEALLRGARGEVVDGGISGVVAELDGVLTVPLGSLPSVTRACWRAEAGGTWREGSLTPAVLRAAARLWLCGSGLGVLPVAELRGPGWARSYPVLWPEVRHPALKPPGM